MEPIQKIPPKQPAPPKTPEPKENKTAKLIAALFR
jgi:hypothetical protein